jgi:hypothetical protein
VTAFKQQVERSDPNTTAELVDVGRLLVLELMGDVVTFYRSYTVGVRS